YTLGEMTGGISLEDASAVVQDQIGRFAEEQLSKDSQLSRIAYEALEHLEWLLRDDQFFGHGLTEFLQAGLRPPVFPYKRSALARGLEDFLQEGAQSGSLAPVLGPFLTALQSEGLREVEADDSQALTWLQDQLHLWIGRLAQDPGARERVNTWCQQTVCK